MILKAIIHVSRGASLKSLFRAGVTVDQENERYVLHLGDAAIFTNYLGIKEQLDKIPEGKTVAFDLAKTVVIDHSVMENLHHFEDDYTRAGGTVEYLGLDQMRPVSKHPYAARTRRGNSDT
jgi:MFS superfamily sulfate permease-like transporter